GFRPRVAASTARAGRTLVKTEIEVPFKALTREEREVVITRTDADETWEVYVSTPGFYRKLIRKGYQPYQTDQNGAFFRVRGLSILRAIKRPAPGAFRGATQKAVSSSGNTL